MDIGGGDIMTSGTSPFFLDFEEVRFLVLPFFSFLLCFRCTIGGVQSSSSTAPNVSSTIAPSVSIDVRPPSPLNKLGLDRFFFDEECFFGDFSFFFCDFRSLDSAPSRRADTLQPVGDSSSVSLEYKLIDADDEELIDNLCGRVGLLPVGTGVIMGSIALGEEMLDA
jgi:hypothetical protein